MDGGRIAWFGINLSSILFDPDEESSFRDMIVQLVDWLAGENTITIDPWKNGKFGAFIINGIVNDKSTDILKPAKFFSELDIKNSLSLPIERYGNYSQWLQNDFDMKGECLLHGDLTDNGKISSAEMQMRRLLSLVSDMKGQMKKPTGFFPTITGMNEHSLKALVDANFDYLYSNEELEQQYPEIIRPDVYNVDSTRIIRLPELIRIGVSNEFEVVDENRFPELLDALRIMYGLSGIIYDGEELSSDYYSGLLEELALTVHADSSIWLTTGSEVANWVNDRDGMVLNSRIKKDRINLELKNLNDHPVETVFLRIYPPLFDSGLEIISASNKCILFDNGYYYRMKIPALFAGEILTVVLEWKNEIPLRTETPAALSWFFIVILGASFIFIVWSFTYFMFSNKKIKVTTSGGRPPKQKKVQPIASRPIRKPVTKPEVHNVIAQQPLTERTVPSPPAEPQMKVRSTVRPYHISRTTIRKPNSVNIVTEQLEKERDSRSQENGLPQDMTDKIGNNDTNEDWT